MKQQQRVASGFYLSTSSTPKTPSSTKTPSTPIAEPNLICNHAVHFLAESKELKPSNGIMPVQRQSHSAVLYEGAPEGRQMIMFGGYKGRKYYNDLFVYDCGKQTWTQRQIVMKNPQTDEIPRGRMWHSGLLLEKQKKMIIFGGETEDEKDLNDLYEYDLVSEKWTQLKPTMTTTTLPQVWPCTRSCHSTCLRKRRINNTEVYSMVVFGGNNDGHKLNDLWEFYFDEKRWVKLSDGIKHKPKVKKNRLLDMPPNDEKEENEQTPKARYNHSAVMQNKTDKMFVFGGKSGPSRLNDLWSYDFATQQWLEVETSGHKPTPRSVHACIMLPGEDHILLFGGYNGNAKMNDMYILDLTTMKWRQLTIYGDVPNPTSNLSVVAANPMFPGQPILLYLFGGYNGDFVVNDLFEISVKEIKDEQCTIAPDVDLFVKEVSSMCNNTNTHCDVIMQLDDKTFYGHRFILSQSAKLRDAFQERESSQTIMLHNVNSTLFEQMLIYLYGNIPELNTSYLVPGLVMAQTFGIDNLVKYLLMQIKNYSYLSSSTVLSLLIDAEKYQQHDVCTYCIRYIRQLNPDLREQLFEKPEFKLLSKEAAIELLKVDDFPFSPMQGRIPCDNAMSPQQALVKHVQATRGTFADVLVTSKDGALQLLAHKSLLSVRSTYFATMFNGMFVDSKKQTIRFDQMDGKILQSVVDYMYCAPIVILQSEQVRSVNQVLMDLACASNMLLVTAMEQACVDTLSKTITPNNVLDMLLFANEMHISSLKKACFCELKQSLNKNELVELIDKLLQ